MNEDPHAVEGKVVLITGASRGIGLAIAGQLAHKGAIVIDASIDSEDSIYPIPGPGHIFHKKTNIADPSEVMHLFAWIDRFFPALDILINNAGVFVFKPLAQISFDEWQHLMKVNLDGAFLCINAALQRMLTVQKGHIINMGSIAGQTPLPGNGAYGVSKAALKMLTQIINEEYAAQGIKASILTLGAVDTQLWELAHLPKPPETLERIRLQNVATMVLHLIEQNKESRLEEIVLLPNYRYTK